MNQVWAVVLAAGEGKRMRSRLPKVLHPLCGRPMLSFILDSAVELTEQIIVIVGHGASQVQEVIGDAWSYVLQEKQLGTGHAVIQAMSKLPAEGTLLVLCGDTPLLTARHLRRVLETHGKSSATVVTANLPDPSGYGRILRSPDGRIVRIVEDKDATEEEKRICEINTGTYCFNLGLLRQYLPRLDTDNAQHEYYLTDVIGLMSADGCSVTASLIEDYRVGLGINSRNQLAEAALLLRERINRDLMLGGVSIEDPHSTVIDAEVQIGPDTVIRPFTVIESGTVIGSECFIGPGAKLRRSKIGDRVIIEHSIIEDTSIPDDTRVDPFTVIRA
jgi:bifunctional UDP-N-acetylglucosamine pyrophosphorylase / glucosamine-1-phosphate N-acetyltransferase